jgi:hypothetical protein
MRSDDSEIIFQEDDGAAFHLYPTFTSDESEDPPSKGGSSGDSTPIGRHGSFDVNDAPSTIRNPTLDDVSTDLNYSQTTPLGQAEFGLSPRVQESPLNGPPHPAFSARSQAGQYAAHASDLTKKALQLGDPRAHDTTASCQDFSDEGVPSANDVHPSKRPTPGTAGAVDESIRLARLGASLLAAAFGGRSCGKRPFLI